MNHSSEFISESPFDERWWQIFLERSGSMTRPMIVKDALEPSRVRAFEDHVLESLRCLGRLRTQRYGFRVYIDGRKLTTAEMDWMYDNAPSQGETLQQWVERVFEGRKFGIIYNTGEKFVPALADEVALMLEPLFSKVGYPREGVQFSVFIGDYDKTPLGIHQDKRGENVMHLHIGPGNKTMHLWDPADYEKLLENEGLSREDVAALQVHGKRYDFSSGDLFFMPEGTYHIGAQEGLSIGITVWQYTHTDDMVARDLHDRIFRQIVPTPQDVVIRADSSELDDTSGLEPITNRYRLRSGLEKLSYADLLRETYCDWRYSIRSNGGYRSSPFERDDTSDLNLDSEVQLARPFPILVRKVDESRKLHVYVRGSRWELNNFACLSKMFDAINDGERRPVRSLIALLDSDWDPAVGLFLLREIHRRRGLSVTQSISPLEQRETSRVIVETSETC